MLQPTAGKHELHPTRTYRSLQLCFLAYIFVYIEKHGCKNTFAYDIHTHIHTHITQDAPTHIFLRFAIFYVS